MTLNVTQDNLFKSFLTQSGVSSLPVLSRENAPVRGFPARESDELVLKNQCSDGKNNKKLFGLIGASVGSALLLTLIAFFTLSKGFSQGFSRKFAKFSENVKKTIAELSSSSEDLTPYQQLKLSVTKKIQPAAEMMEASANITAIKDSCVNKVLKKIKMEKFVKTINKFFKDKIVLTTKNEAYKKAEYSVVAFCNYLEKIADAENIPELAQKSDELMNSYANKFSTQIHVKRTNKNWENMNGLSDKVFERLFKFDTDSDIKFNQFYQKAKNLRTYITIDMSSPDRIKLKKELIVGEESVKNKLSEAIDLIPQKQKKQAVVLGKTVEKKLKKAIISEIKAFNKLAEIQVGSVATDILGILVPSALATGLIINSENKNERIGTTLTQGIPIFGGLGVSYYGVSRGFTGVKNLALGLSTMFILNQLGTHANGWYKKYTERQSKLKESYDVLYKQQI